MELRRVSHFAPWLASRVAASVRLRVARRYVFGLQALRNLEPIFVDERAAPRRVESALARRQPWAGCGQDRLLKADPSQPKRRRRFLLKVGSDPA
jgi:hypothetical protein